MKIHDIGLLLRGSGGTVLLDNYEAEHDYDEYHYELDDIEHDPYVLISAITALMGREWTISEVGGILDMLFEKQYILTETVETETRYRTETRTGSYTYYDYELEDWVTEEYEYEVEVPYTYYICTVKLENFNLSHVPVYIMSQEQLSLYAMYMGTLGNRPDLFGGSSYVGRYYGSEYPKYEIPPEALEDEQFAAIIKEAEALPPNLCRRSPCRSRNQSAHRTTAPSLTLRFLLRA